MRPSYESRSNVADQNMSVWIKFMFAIYVIFFSWDQLFIWVLCCYGYLCLVFNKIQFRDILCVGSLKINRHRCSSIVPKIHRVTEINTVYTETQVVIWKVMPLNQLISQRPPCPTCGYIKWDNFSFGFVSNTGCYDYGFPWFHWSSTDSY